MLPPVPASERGCAYAGSVQANKVLGAGAVFAFLGVAAGAFGAHALRDDLTPESMAIYQTAVQYQVVHAVALVALASQTRVRTTVAAWLFIAGILVFSGSLYGLAVSGIRALGAITPIGGVCFLAGWAYIAWQAFAARE